MFYKKLTINYEDIIKFCKKHKKKFNYKNNKIFFKPFNNKKIILWRGASLKVSSLAFDLDLGSFFSSKGYSVEYILCGGLLTICTKKSVENLSKWNSMCVNCRCLSRDVLKASGANYSFMEKWVDINKRNSIRKLANQLSIKDLLQYYSDEIDIGVIVASTFNRTTFATKIAEEVKDSDGFFIDILRECFYSSLICLNAAKEIVKKEPPDYVYMHHSCYSSWGPAFQYFANAGIPCVCSDGGRLRGTRVYKICSKADITGANLQEKWYWNKIKNIELSAEERSHLSHYMISVIKDADKKQKVLPNEIYKFKEKNKPTWLIAVQQNWDWDGRNFWNDDYFRSTADWIKQTLSFIKNINNVNWLIKPYPDTRKNVRNICVEILGCDNFPHIIVLNYRCFISPYRLFPTIDGCVVMTGTLGLESTLFGLPVIGCAPWAFYGDIIVNKFINKNNYFNQLKNIRSFGKINEKDRRVAERLGYDYFINKQIPIGKIDLKNKTNDKKIKMIGKKIINLEPIRNDNVKICRSTEDWISFLKKGHK